MRRIKLAEMAPHVHTFLPNENKTDKLAKWLIAWITIALQGEIIKPYDLLPLKSELACHIGVSLGTMQNVYRILEDAGYIESKQKIGSFIKDRKFDNIEKLTSKKDLATDVIKKFLKDNNYKKGDSLISTRKLSEITGVSSATIRAAVTNLVLQGILEKKKNLYVLTGRSFKTHNVEAKTLVEKVAENIKQYVNDNLKQNDRIPPSTELAKMFNVSVKTVHDAAKLLAKEGLLYTRRGRYGTVVAENSESKTTSYHYEIIEQKILAKISSDYKVGDKLSSIKMLSKEYKTSEKTVKKALDNLASDGYLTFMRGRYGGTFVTDLPQKSADAYTWIAINSDYLN
ncbi:MAG: GntR family transcriptional regulator [bacterium]|nr:GntR family transcriptional regulator [bacterium]